MHGRALVCSQKKGAPREMAVKTEGSAPKGLCGVPTVCRVLWVSWLPGPGIKAFSSMGSGLCLVLPEVASVPSHTVKASDLGPARNVVGKSWYPEPLWGLQEQIVAERA